MTVKGGAGYVELLSDFADGEIRVAEHGSCGLELGGIELGWTSEGLAGGVRSFQTGSCALLDNGSLELGEGPADLEQGAAGRAGGVELLGKGMEG